MRKSYNRDDKVLNPQDFFFFLRGPSHAQKVQGAAFVLGELMV